MRKLVKSREEFNQRMPPYTAMIVQTEHKPFSEDFFSENGLISPSNRVKYTPPPWVGAEYQTSFISFFERMRDTPEKWRDELIPYINPEEKYLVCDDYSGDGETFESAIVRLVQKGVNLDNIWCISMGGNREFNNEVVLDKGNKWHNYRKRQDSHMRKILEREGFVFPSLE